MSNGLEITAVVCMVFFGLIVTIQLVLISILLVVMKNLVQTIREHIDPLLSKVNSLLIVANDVAQTVQGKTEHIAEKTAETTDHVSERIEKVTQLLQGVVASPLIQGAAVAEGFREGVSTWRRAKTKRKPADKKCPPPESIAPEDIEG